MTPQILAVLVVVIIALDFIIDLQLYGVSVGASLSVIAALEYFGVGLEVWQMAALFAVLVAITAFGTRKLIKTTDKTEDINKY